MVLLASMVGLSGCAKPPVTGDIVIGSAHQLSAEIYRKLEQENPEHLDSYIQDALSAGIPRQAIRDGRVLTVSCSNMGNFGQWGASYYLLLPKGIRPGDHPIVVFEAVHSPWDRATQSYSYALSRFIRLSDFGYRNVPRGCLWYHNGRLVEGYDDSFGWAEREDERDKLPKSLEDFLSE